MVPPAREVAATMTATAARAPHIITFLPKLKKYFATLIILTTDYIAVVLASVAAWYMRAIILPLVFTELTVLSIDNIYIFCVIPSCYICFLAYEGMYSRRLPLWQDAEYLFKISTYVTGLIVAVTYFAGDSGNVSRIFILLTWIFSFIFLALARYGTKRVLTICGAWQKPVVIVGAGKTAALLAKTFEDEPTMGYDIVGLIEDEISERPLMTRYPHIGRFADMEDAIVSSGVEDVIIATPGIEREEMIGLFHRVYPLVRNIHIVPNLLGMPISNIEINPLFNSKTILLKVNNNLMMYRNRLFKRCFDIVAGSIALIIVSPLLVIASLLIYLESPGPVLLTQLRPGKNGEMFGCFKFRSMVANAEGRLKELLLSDSEILKEWEEHGKLKNDPRITKVGQFIRRTSIDELPQLLNVLLGNMSLVGPRPMLIEQMKQKKLQQERHGNYICSIERVVPGITGLWQVSGRSDITFEARMQLESWYVHNWSIWLDMVILLKTIRVVVSRAGAY